MRFHSLKKQGENQYGLEKVQENLEKDSPLLLVFFWDDDDDDDDYDESDESDEKSLSLLLSCLF